jgi:hypothetical protein
LLSTLQDIAKKYFYQPVMDAQGTNSIGRISAAQQCSNDDSFLIVHQTPTTQYFQNGLPASLEAVATAPAQRARVIFYPKKIVSKEHVLTKTQWACSYIFIFTK